MSALRAEGHRDIGNQGGADALTGGHRGGAGDETSGSDLAGIEWALTWLQAADSLGIDPRSLRRWRARYESDQQLGLYDRRQLPSPRKAPVDAVQNILRLYRQTYHGFNIRHFHHLLRRDHGGRCRTTSSALPCRAGLVAKRRARGRHRRRREP